MKPTTDTDWEISEIQNHKVIDGVENYFVVWKSTWVPVEFLENAQETLEAYKATYRYK